MIKSKRENAVSRVAFRPADAARLLYVHCWDASGCAQPLLSWLASEGNVESVIAQLREQGAVCLRGFARLSAEEFATVTARLCGAQLEYRERTTPRSVIDQAVTGVYTSTEYPGDQEIFLHNENAYASHWPEYLCFYCEEPAQIGGETTLADLHKVEAGISPELARLISARGLLHRRIFIEGVGVSWQTAFNVAHIDELRCHCAQAGLSVTAGDDRIMVEHRHSPYARHARTHERRWFNHAAFFQSDKVDARVTRALEHLLGSDELPNRILYGDGTPLEQAVVAELTQAYRAALVAHAWQRNDLVVLDNMRYAHGRRPFGGTRRVWVSMANQLNRVDLQV